MSVEHFQYFYAPVVGFAIGFLAMEKFFCPTKDEDRATLVGLTTSALFFLLFFLCIIPVINNRIYLTPDRLMILDECNVIAFTIVLWIVNSLVIDWYDRVPYTKEGVILLGLGFGYALMEKYFVADLFNHRVAAVICSLWSIRGAYQFLYLMTNRRIHSTFMLRVLRMTEWMMILPAIADARYGHSDITEPPHPYTIMYVVMFSVWWMYTGYFATGGITQPPQRMYTAPLVMLHSGVFLPMLTMGSPEDVPKTVTPPLSPTHRVASVTPPPSPTKLPAIAEEEEEEGEDFHDAAENAPPPPPLWTGLYQSVFVEPPSVQPPVLPPPPFWGNNSRLALIREVLGDQEHERFEREVAGILEEQPAPPATVAAATTKRKRHGRKGK